MTTHSISCVSTRHCSHDLISSCASYGTVLLFDIMMLSKRTKAHRSISVDDTSANRSYGVTYFSQSEEGRYLFITTRNHKYVNNLLHLIWIRISVVDLYDTSNEPFTHLTSPNFTADLFSIRSDFSFSSFGPTLVSGSSKGTICVWTFNSTISKVRSCAFNGHTGDVTCVSLASKGEAFVSLSLGKC